MVRHTDRQKMSEREQRYRDREGNGQRETDKQRKSERERREVIHRQKRVIVCVECLESDVTNFHRFHWNPSVKVDYSLLLL